MKIKKHPEKDNGWTPVTVTFDVGEQRGRFRGKKDRTFRLAWSGEGWADSHDYDDLERQCGPGPMMDILIKAQP